MAATATPMGAEPVGGLSACGSFSGKVRHMKIASAYGTTIFYGDFVKLVNTGTVEKIRVQLLLLRLVYLWAVFTQTQAPASPLLTNSGLLAL